MNKKAVDFRTVTFLIAVVIIAILLIVFYLWQGMEGKEVKGKLTIASENVHKNRILVDLLNHPVDSEKTIGDAIAQGELDTACKEIKQVIAWLYSGNRPFLAEFDDDEFCESDIPPSRATRLQAFIPTRDNEVKEVVLEI
ncbi:hypothetical protein GF343_02295 [Candidatus Woesearchaeota archaeon]|nr:hypothetical protein [Candidatus Woesearchaeota archaeon]